MVKIILKVFFHLSLFTFSHSDQNPNDDNENTVEHSGIENNTDWIPKLMELFKNSSQINFYKITRRPKFYKKPNQESMFDAEDKTSINNESEVYDLYQNFPSLPKLNYGSCHKELGGKCTFRKDCPREAVIKSKNSRCFNIIFRDDLYHQVCCKFRSQHKSLHLKKIYLKKPHFLTADLLRSGSEKSEKSSSFQESSEDSTSEDSEAESDEKSSSISNSSEESTQAPIKNSMESWEEWKNKTKNKIEKRLILKFTK